MIDFTIGLTFKRGRVMIDNTEFRFKVLPLEGILSFQFGSHMFVLVMLFALLGRHEASYCGGNIFVRYVVDLYLLKFS